MGKNLPCVQKRKLATKTCPPNAKRFDDPPTKKPKVAQPAPEFHIAVNLAPTLGGSALQGACVVSNSPLPQVASASAPGPLRLGEITSLEGGTRSSSAPDLGPLGRRIPVTRACKMLLQMLSEAADTRRAPRSYDILTWMDAENPEVDGLYIDSFGDFKDLGIKDAFDIIETEVFYLAPFGYLGRGGALRLRQCVRDKILIPLGLWDTTPDDSIGSVENLLDIRRLIKWRDEVENGHVEEIEETSDMKVEEVEDIEDVDEAVRSESSGIEEIEGWWENVNVGQWEEEV